MTEKPQAERSLLTEHGVVKAGHSHRRARNELLALMPTLVHRIAVDTDAVIFNALARTTQGVLMGVWLQRSANTVFGVGATTPGVLAAALRPKGHDVRRLGVRRLLAMRSDTDARVVPLRRIGAVCLMSPMAAGALGRLDYALFAAAAQHAGAATTTVLFEMWPLVMVLMVPAQSRYRAAGWMLMASAGVPMVVLGYNSDISSGGSWTGAALGLAAAFLAGCAVAADLAAGGALHTRYERRSDQQRTNATLGLPAQQTVRVAQRRWLAVACALVACAVIAPSSAPSNLLLFTAGAATVPAASFAVHKAQPPTGGAHDETLRQTPR